MAAGSWYSCEVQSCVSDHSALFETRFGGKTFGSYKDFEVQLRKFKEECMIHFRVRSSALSVPGDPCIYKRLTLVCTYSASENPSVSLGLRHRRTKSRGCPAKFSVTQRNGVLVAGGRCKDLVHNHLCSEMEYLLDPSSRRLTAEQRADAMRLLRYGARPIGIRMMARLDYRKYLTPSDVNNLRCRFLTTAVPAGSLGELKQLVCINGGFNCTRDEYGRIEVISFCRNEQKDLFSRYPEVVCVDATYKVNRKGYCLLQYVATDGLGHGRSVLFSLMRNEKCSTYVTAFLNIRDLLPSVHKVQTFMVDMSVARMNAIHIVFPGKKILLCQFHLMRAIQRKTKNRVVWHLVRRLMRTRSIVKFNALCQRLRQKYPGFYIYFCRVWLRHARRWAVCYRSGTVCLGNQTNNRAESAHRWLKEDLSAADTLLNCCKRIWLSSHQMLVDYSCHVALSRINRPVVAMNNPLAGVVRGLTRYAAERMLKDWESSENNAMSVIGVYPRFRVTEKICLRPMAYRVDVSKAHCTCVFNQYYAMPCRHLVFACMKAKVGLDVLLVNSRWLDVRLDGRRPREVSFSHPPRPVKKVSKMVAAARRAIRLERQMDLKTSEAFVEDLSTLTDVFEVFQVVDPASHSQENDIPPLRQRISGNAIAGLTTICLPTGKRPSTQMSALPHTPVPSTSHAPKIRKVPLLPQLPVDLDDEDKENYAVSRTSDSAGFCDIL